MDDIEHLRASLKRISSAVESLKDVFPPPRSRSDYAEQIALFDLYKAANGIATAVSTSPGEQETIAEPQP